MVASILNDPMRLTVYDFHSHTDFSDGKLSPTQLIDRAVANGVSVLSIADHDTVMAYSDKNIFGYAKSKGIHLIPGIEISTVDSSGTKVHILGIGVDAENRLITEWSDGVKLSRTNYARSTIELLEKDGWVPANKHLLYDANLITKAHIADIFISNTDNHVRFNNRFGIKLTRGSFIEMLMNKSGVAYVKKEETISPGGAIRLIHKAGGLAIMAHPVSLVYEQGKSIGDIKKFILRHEFDGLESIYYYYHKSGGDVLVDMVDEFVALANDLGLLITMGSDFHGADSSLGNFVDIGMKSHTKSLGRHFAQYGDRVMQRLDV